MQVEAVYNNGQLQFITPPRLKPGSLRVTVTIPDEAVESETEQPIPREVRQGAQEMLARMETIRNVSLPADADIPELTAKQQERIEAAALRDEIKAMR